MTLSSSSSDADIDPGSTREEVVQVLLPESENVAITGGTASSGAAAGGTTASGTATGAAAGGTTASGTATGASASSVAPIDTASVLVDKAIAELPPELAAIARDPKRKARSRDPGWKYGFWPEIGRKEMVQCVFCKKIVPSGIKRFKQHMAGGFADVEKCPKAPAIIRQELHEYLLKNARSRLAMEDEGEQEHGRKEGQGEQAGTEDEDEDEGEEVQGGSGSGTVAAGRPTIPSSGTKSKHAKKRAQAPISSFLVAGPAPPQKYSKSVSSMLCKTPEEVVAERHKSKSSQSTLEHCTKKSTEAKQIVDDHVADFFYENGIPFNVINSRSWEILLESIGQYGPGYRSPSMHEIRNPLLERAVEKTKELRKKHEEAWKEYGCTLMSDGWTDTSHRHLINFLANSPAGTFFIGSVDASSQIADATMLADLLESQIEKIGKQYVVQIVTDNGANFKAAGRLLMERIPTLFWTPCAAHCLDLMLEDIGKINEFDKCITSAKKVCRFFYKHGRILDQMREKIGGDLVRPAVTRFATSFLTLASMHSNRQGLRCLVISDEWHGNKLSTGAEGKMVESTILSVVFWTSVENCMRASQPLLIALRLADSDESPAAPEIMAAMDHAKTTIKDALKEKPQLLK